MNERLNQCKKCLNRKTNLQKGLFCSLTGEKPDFVNICDNYSMDKTIENKITLEQKKEDSNKQRRKLTIISIGIFLLLFLIISVTYNSVVAIQTKKFLEKNLDKFAYQIERSINTLKPLYINDAFQTEELTQKIFLKRKLEKGFEYQYRKAVNYLLEREFNLGYLTVEQIKDGGHFSYRGYYFRNKNPHILFRLYSSKGGLNFFDFELRLINKKLYIIDMYNYFTGQWLSELISNSIPVSFSNATLPNGIDGYDLNRETKKLIEINQLISDSLIDSAYYIFRTIPKKIRKLSMFQIANLNINKGLSMEAYNAAIDEFISFNKGNYPFVYFHKLMKFYNLNNSDSVMRYLKLLDENIASDPIFYLYFGNIMYNKGKYKEAIMNYDSLINSKTNVFDIYWMKLNALKEINDTNMVYQTLNVIQKKFNLSKEEIYNNFLEDSAWKEYTQIKKWYDSN